MVRSCYLPPAGAGRYAAMDPLTHTHANTQLVQMDHRSANPKGPLCPPDDRFMLTRRVLALDQVTGRIQNL